MLWIIHRGTGQSHTIQIRQLMPSSKWLAAVEAVEDGGWYFGVVLAEEAEGGSEFFNLLGGYGFAVGGEVFCPRGTSKRSGTQHLPFF